MRKNNVSLFLITIVLFVSIGCKESQTQNNLTVNQYAALQLVEKLIPSIETGEGFWIQWQDSGHGVISMSFNGVDKKDKDSVWVSWLIGCDRRNDKFVVTPNEFPSQYVNVPAYHPAIDEVAKIFAVVILQRANSSEARAFVPYIPSRSDDLYSYINNLLSCYPILVQEDFTLMPGNHTDNGWTDSGKSFLFGIRKDKKEN
ncbi:MAG: hypothetical protein HYW78_01935 [Parcubacteria group bacterium]|nr:hypothetical protein [Parcubacteria group bacterium]